MLFARQQHDLRQLLDPDDWLDTCLYSISEAVHGDSYRSNQELQYDTPYSSPKRSLPYIPELVNAVYAYKQDRSPARQR